MEFNYFILLIIGIVVFGAFVIELAYVLRYVGARRSTDSIEYSARKNLFSRSDS